MTHDGREREGTHLDTQLVDALMHLLIEKGVLTRNDALSVVQTVAQVQRGRLHDGTAPDAVTNHALRTLRRMYTSFESVSDRPGTLQMDGDNIHRLRPPLHGDHPEFPVED